MDAKGAKKKRIVGVALCGFGRAGHIHFDGVRQSHRCRLKYVVEQLEVSVAVEGGSKTMREVLQGTFEEYNMENVGLVSKNEFDRVLRDPDVDAVIVATPTNAHEGYVRRALEAGKAVFCEKPLAMNIADTAYCYDVAAKVGLPLYCAFQRRFDDGLGGLRHQVKEGKIGKVFQIKSTSRDSPRPSIEYLKISNGIYHDCAVHDFDMVCWVVGEEPDEVMAQGFAFDPEIKAIGDVDTVAVILKFPCGVIATIDLSRHSTYGYDQRMEVYGEKGMLVCENPVEDPIQHYHPEGTSTSKLFYSFPKRYEIAYRRELEHFIDAVLDPTVPLLVTRESTLLSSRVADACERAQKEKRAVGLEPAPPCQDVKLQ